VSGVTPFRVTSASADLACVRFGQGPPLVLAHPLAFSKAYFAAAADVFGAHFTAVAFDQRGHGETEGDPDDLEACAEDVGAILDHLGWPKAIVGGTSLGAATALVFARRHPERVERLVQDLPGFGPRSPRAVERAEGVARALAGGDFEGAVARITEGLSPPRAKAWREALLSDWRRYDPARLGPNLARAFRATTRWKVADRWPDDLRALAVPTRILAVRGDPGHPYEVAEAMARAIPDARLVPRVPSLSAEAIARQWVEVLRAP
jgi:3-oxoadipate enol-lactonase